MLYTAEYGKTMAGYAYGMISIDSTAQSHFDQAISDPCRVGRCVAKVGLPIDNPT